MNQNSIPLFFFLDSIPLVGIVLQICLLMSKVNDIIHMDLDLEVRGIFHVQAAFMLP